MLKRTAPMLCFAFNVQLGLFYWCKDFPRHDGGHCLFFIFKQSRENSKKDYILAQCCRKCFDDHTNHFHFLLILK